MNLFETDQSKRIKELESQIYGLNWSKSELGAQVKTMKAFLEEASEWSGYLGDKAQEILKELNDNTK